MIFSLSNVPAPITLSFATNVDYICFFSYLSSVKSDETLWFEIMISSLKLKRSVLVLESHLTTFPSIDETKRWQIEEAWLYVTPRALNAITCGYTENPPLLENLKIFLKNFN